MQQLPHAAMGAAVRTYQGRLGQGRQEDGGPPRRAGDAGHLCVRPEAVHRAAGRISDLDPRARLLRQCPVQAAPAADRRRLHQSRGDRVRASPRRRARTLHAARRPAVRVAARRRHERQIRLLHRSLLLCSRAHRHQDRRRQGNPLPGAERSRTRRTQHDRRRRHAPGRSRRRRARAAVRSPGQCHRRHGQRDRQIRSGDRPVHELVGRPRHVRPGSGRQRLEFAEERRSRQVRHQQRRAEEDDLPASQEQGNLRHRYRLQGPDQSLYLDRRQDRHLRSAGRPNTPST